MRPGLGSQDLAEQERLRRQDEEKKRADAERKAQQDREAKRKARAAKTEARELWLQGRFLIKSFGVALGLGLW